MDYIIGSCVLKRVFMKKLFLLLTILSLNCFYVPCKSNTRCPSKERVACHEEYDYIKSKMITVCGNYTNYPATTYGIPLSDSVYYTWLNYGTYEKKIGRISYYDPDSKSTYPSDIYVPTNVNNLTLKSKIIPLTIPQDVESVQISYTVKESVETTITHSGAINLGMEIASFLSSFKFKLSASYEFTYSVSNYHSEEITYTSTFVNTRPYYLMQIMQYQVYLPIKIRMYKLYNPGSYIYKEHYAFFKVLDVVVRSWGDNGFTDPWNVRGFVNYNIYNDIIQTHSFLG